MHTESIINQFNHSLTPVEYNDCKRRLIEHLNNLIQYDFHQLVQLLYRVDVNEEKLKSILHHQQEKDAALIIADLLIERQLQKLKTKEQHSSNNGMPEEEKW